MFALLVSSKGFCAADEETPGAEAAAASAKPIEDIRTYMMFDYPEEKIPPVPAPIQKEGIEEIYDTYAAKLPVVLYTSYPTTGVISDTLQSILRGLKPGQEILIRGIYYPSTIDSISECGVVLSSWLREMHAAVFRGK